MGSAYRTNIEPRFEPRNDNAVYAVWPPALFLGGLTTLIAASTSSALGDTCLYPVAKSGHLVCGRLIGCWNTPIHRTALRNAGYELELVVPRG